MKKKIICIVLALFLAATLLPAAGLAEGELTYPVKTGVISYEISDGEITITGATQSVTGAD
ncbi:MAG: hypothetical protein IIY34_01870, partial [Clostridia bacterium]|nr:hypothetical protein [Clostridia bacterium]